MRIDQLLVERGLAASRAQAQRLLAGGAQWRVGQGAWKPVGKNGDNVPDDAELQLQDNSEARYVSRGGLKLEGALAATGLDVAGSQCLDIGQSTGGFTDCLLQQGAAHVVGVDVGQGQLHPRLRGDARVTCIEQVNARALDASDLIAACADVISAGGQFDLKFEIIVGDLSFISLTLVLPALVPLLADGGALLMLVKPQFELQPGQVGKGGIVKDERIHACCAELGLTVQSWFPSPIEGGDGNREFFVFAKRAA